MTNAEQLEAYKKAIAASQKYLDKSARRLDYYQENAEKILTGIKEAVAKGDESGLEALQKQAEIMEAGSKTGIPMANSFSQLGIGYARLAAALSKPPGQRF